MTKFPSEKELLAYCESLGIQTDLADRISPPNYKYKFDWELTKQKTDDIVMKRFYSTEPAVNDDVLGFIKATHDQGVTALSYRYFDSADALDGEITVNEHETIFGFCKTRSIGQVELGSYPEWFKKQYENVPPNQRPDNLDSTWEFIKIEYKELVHTKDEELWTLFLWLVGKSNSVETKYYNIDHWRLAPRLRLAISRQRFSTGLHIISYDTFDPELRDSLLSSLRKYLVYFNDIQNQHPIKLTIILEDPGAPSGKKAVEFIDESANQEDIDLTVSFREYCYTLMVDNLEQFNKVYRELVSHLNAEREELATHILSDSEFAKCSNRPLRQAYIESLLEKDDFKKYKPCFQLTDLNDWLEQQHFTDELYVQLKEVG